MPENLNITLDELTAIEAEGQPLAHALLAGRVVATVVSGRTGRHITVQLKCRRKSGEKWVPSDYAEATHVSVDVPGASDWPAHGNDKVGTYYPLETAQKYAGTFWPDRCADPARAWAALFVLRAAAGRAVSDQAELLLGVNCLMCGRELTDPESIARNIGPDCYGRATGSDHQRKARPERAGAALSGEDAPTRGATSIPDFKAAERLRIAQTGAALFERRPGQSYRDVERAA